jgi:hypothetical protein
MQCSNSSNQNSIQMNVAISQHKIIFSKIVLTDCDIHLYLMKQRGCATLNRIVLF